jgi:hypothetical protein
MSAESVVGEQRLIWWELRDDEYQEIAPTLEGLLVSRNFPGLCPSAKQRQGPPLGATERFEGLARSWQGASARRQHDTPARGGKGRGG